MQKSKLNRAATLVLLATCACLVVSGCAGTTAMHEERIERGWVDRSVLQDPDHMAFRITYDTVKVGQDFVDMIRTVNAGVDVTVVFGTWCSDSMREVPRFLKIADLAGISPSRIKLYAVDRTKKSSDGVTEGYQIELVPTFVFLKDGKEVGRITETPRVSMEADMLSIFAGVQAK